MVDNDRIISLVHTIAADPELLHRLTATLPAERGAVLAEIGYGDVSPADLVGSENLFAPSSVEEIDDEQLVGVAGGDATLCSWTNPGYPTTLAAAT